MIAIDENALICDFAETYHIYDYRKLPCIKAAIFASGLRDSSRIKMKMSNQVVSPDTMLLAGVLDRLSLLVWMQTKDGQKGTNKPTMIADMLGNTEAKRKEIVAFYSGKEFEERRKEIIENMEKGGKSWQLS